MADVSSHNAVLVLSVHHARAQLKRAALLAREAGNADSAEALTRTRDELARIAGRAL